MYSGFIVRFYDTEAVKMNTLNYNKKIWVTFSPPSITVVIQITGKVIVYIQMYNGSKYIKKIYLKPPS